MKLKYNIREYKINNNIKNKIIFIGDYCFFNNCVLSKEDLKTVFNDHPISNHFYLYDLTKDFFDYDIPLYSSFIPEIEDYDPFIVYAYQMILIKMARLDDLKMLLEIEKDNKEIIIKIASLGIEDINNKLIEYDNCFILEEIIKNNFNPYQYKKIIEKLYFVQSEENYNYYAISRYLFLLFDYANENYINDFITVYSDDFKSHIIFYIKGIVRVLKERKLNSTLDILKKTFIIDGVY